MEAQHFYVLTKIVNVKKRIHYLVYNQVSIALEKFYMIKLNQ